MRNLPLKSRQESIILPKFNPFQLAPLLPVMIHSLSDSDSTPLADLDEWEEFVVSTYPEGGEESAQVKSFRTVDPEKKKEEFRNYESTTRESVRRFYALNHRHQTLDFVRKKKADYLQFDRREMSIWEALEYLNTLVDESDPDTDLSQLDHLLQTSENIRRDGHPRWFVLTGLIHDLGKILCLFGEPQWAVVGDTFPVGCRFSDKIVFHPYFEENPDSRVPEYQTELGIYEEGAGLDQVELSWGHDEYLYHVVKDYLPDEALYMIRYHSFYPWHRENAYEALTNEKDREMKRWVQAFNPYDLYSKSHEPPVLEKLRPYYEDLIGEFFPAKLRW